MIGNKTLIQKADLKLSDLTNDGGALVAAQARRLIRTLINESTVMPMATVVAMRSPTQLIEKIRFANRVLRAGSEGQALNVNDRASPEMGKEELNAQLFKAEVRLNNEVLEDSIERGNLRQTVMAVLAERVALDMDEMIVQGDTTSLDPFLAKFDGILKLASINTVAVGTNPLSKTIFRDMLKAMPNEFLRNKRRMRFLTSVDALIDYADTTNSRETNLGDRYLENDVPIAYRGIPIMDVPVFPEDLGVGANETNVLLTDPKNINVGIWRRVTMETDKDISAGVLIVVATLRFDVVFAEPRATVRADGVSVS